MPRVWKGLHMLVYAAYAAVVLHVALGSLAGGGNVMMPLVIAASLTGIITLHLLAGWRAARKDRLWLDGCTIWVDPRSILWRCRLERWGRLWPFPPQFPKPFLARSRRPG
jgi:hypothetical protein